MNFDILVAGAGPAGAATVLCIKKMAPGLSVCLVDPGRADPPVGEGLPPPAGTMLKELGLWDDFLAQNHLEAHHTKAAWGSANLQTNDFLLLGKGCGWTLDRPAFNRLLRTRAAECADHVVESTLQSLQRHGNDWRAVVDGQTIEARTIVDATGRSAALGRLLGYRPELKDKLVAVVCQADVPNQTETGVVIDAAPDGWWYSAPTSPSRRIWVWMTDSDLLRSQPVSDPARWNDALQSSDIMANIAEGARFGNRHIVPAMTQRMPALADTPSFLSVGDSASCFDPASSQGITKALRSGIFAGYALYDFLVKGDQSAFSNHRSHVAAEYIAYKTQHNIHYGAETRWPDRPFWRRRLGTDAVHHADLPQDNAALHI